MTGEELIRLALINAGCISLAQTLYAEDLYLGRDLLNNILAQWQRKRWLVPSLVETAVLSTGVASYTVGVGGTVPIARPDKIDSAFARLLPGTSSTSIAGTAINGGVLTIPDGSSLPTSPTGLPNGSYWNNGGVVCVVTDAVDITVPSQIYVDYPLAIIESREDYNRIALKALTTFPASVFYQSSYPLGVLYFWPIPAAGQFELHIATKAALPSLTALTTDISAPPEYMQALMYVLCRALRPAYGLAPDRTIETAAAAALNTIRMANVQIPTLGLPGAVLPRRGGSVSAASDPHFQTGWW